MITYIRSGPMPICKHCKRRMSYWIPGMPNGDHAHVECEAEHAANSAMEIIKAALADRGDDNG